MGLVPFVLEYLLLLVPFIVCTFVNAAEDSHFDVKPGGTVLEHESSQNGFTCKFIYACQGGTKEDWVMSIDTSNDQYTCSVGRPSGTSYLFFQQFKVMLEGAVIQDAHVQADSSTSLKPEEYKIDQAENSVYHVEGKFGSKLASVNVLASKKKTEL